MCNELPLNSDVMPAVCGMKINNITSGIFLTIFFPCTYNVKYRLRHCIFKL